MKPGNTLRVALLLVISCCLMLVCHAQEISGRTPEGSSPTAVPDLDKIKKELAVFQGVLDTTLRQSLTGPFPILGSIKGTYLPDYGAVFSLEVNVYQIRQLSPFDLRPLTEKELNEAQAQMTKRIELVKGLIVKAIGEHGFALQELSPEQNVTVVAHLFSAAREPKKDAPSQLIFSAKRNMIRDYREARISAEQFSKNVRLLQF